MASTTIIKGALLAHLAISGSINAVERVVCLGDSITDGYTYPLLVMQALREAGRPVPVLVCSGVGGHTARQMTDRLHDTVLRFEPGLVSLLAGTNDAMRKVDPDDYAAAVREIAAALHAGERSMVLMTPCIIVRADGETEEERSVFRAELTARLDGYEAALRAVAAEYGWAVAENRAMMEEAVQAGRAIMDADGIHPNYLGQRVIARALLDAMGHKDVALPETFRPPMFPGVVSRWWLRRAPVDERGRVNPLTEDTVSRLEPDDQWVSWTLPEPMEGDGSAEDWRDQLRLNGFATRYQHTLGAGPIHAVADIESDRSREVVLNMGGDVKRLWHNGSLLYDQRGVWDGFHAGRTRIPVAWTKGRHRLVLEVSGPEFFVSVTDDLVWEHSLAHETVGCVADTHPIKRKEK